jgi:hypothetical protein
MGMREDIDDLNKELKKAAKVNATLQADIDVLSKENDDLRDQIVVLKQSTSDLLAKNEELQKQIDTDNLNDTSDVVGRGDRLVGAAVGAGRRFIRGKIGGNKYIKTDAESGKYEEISKEEFDKLN